MTKPNNDLLLDLYFSHRPGGTFNEYLILSKVIRDQIPTWFRPMLEDEARNEFYREMIKGKVRDKVVIDLGAGTGLWAMESLAQGAKFVYLVEKNPLLVRYLEKVLKGYPVKIVGKDFKDLVIEDFDQGRPDVIIHEIFSTTATDEGIIPTFQKLSGLFDFSQMELLPSHFTLEARVSYIDPMKLTNNENQILASNQDVLFELIHPLRYRLRGWGAKSYQTENEAFALLKIDLKQLEREKAYSLNEIPLQLIPGKVHNIYVTFKFFHNDEGRCFDTSKVENHHWGGGVVEFYYSRKFPQQQKNLRLSLTKNAMIESPVLQD